MKRIVLGLVLMSVTAQGQTRRNGMLYPIMPGQPGQYDIVERAQIEKNRLDFAEKMELQDKDAYDKATAEADKTYHEMYGSCAPGAIDWTACTGLQQLRQIHTATVLSKAKVIESADLQNAINTFKQLRDNFQTRLAAVSVMKDVWTNVGSQTSGDHKAMEAFEVYKKGALNLKAFTDVYTDGINKMVGEAMSLTYRVNNNSAIITTQPSMGLEEVATTDTPDSFRQQLEVFQAKGNLTADDKQNLAAAPIAIGKQMSEFVNANNIHLYWMNKMQKGDASSWTDSLQTKARIVNYMKAVYCSPLGVPAMDIPPLKQWDLGYLTRGSGGLLRIVQKSETDEDAIRATLMRFDEAFLSLRSQGGEFNNAGGIIGFLNKANSTLTWQNEVQAWLSVMKILRDMYQDEVDLQADPVAGCDKVRDRYYAKYGSIKDNKGFQQTVDLYLSGRISSPDSTIGAFKTTGTVVLTKVKYMRDGQLFLAKHPAASILGQSIDQDDQLK